MACNDLHSLAVKLRVRSLVGPADPKRALLLAFRFVGQSLDEGWLTLGLQLRDARLDFLVGNEGTMYAGEAPTMGHVQHDPLPPQVLGAGLPEDCPAVDLAGDMEVDADQEVRFD